MTDGNDAELRATTFVSEVIDKVMKKGVDAADGILLENTSLSASQRLGKREDLERSEASSLGLRVLIGKRQAIVSSSKKTEDAINQLIERAVDMARVTPEDPFVSLADSENLAKQWPTLKILDKCEPLAEKLYDYAGIAETAAVTVQGITNSEGAEASWNRTTAALATSEGFAGAYSGSIFSISATAIAGNGTNMERDYDYAIARFESELKDPKEIGRCAGERAIKRLNPKKIKSAHLPVVYDWRVAPSILGHFSNAVNGQSVARQTSFLKEKMGEEIFAPSINIVDEPHRLSGIASRPFDGEGVQCKKINLVSEGRLQSWILDTSSARQLNLKTTGHASRGTSTPPSPSPSNLYLTNGDLSVEQMIKNIKEGVFITELIGMGVNIITGDYSRGAAGFYIRNGEITHPISEITIASNLESMFQNLTAANDLEFRYGTNSPTVCIEGMTIAGS